MSNYRKTYEITGYTHNGSTYCLVHMPEETEDEEGGIIFLDSETDSVQTCDVCGEEIETTIIPYGADDYEHSLSAYLHRE